MGHFQKIQAAGGKMPRKLKKRIKKIPVGSYCYGTALGDKGKMIHGKRKRDTIYCPYWKWVGKLSKDGDKQAYCSLVHEVDDFSLADQVKICGDYEYFFPEFKPLKGMTHEQIMQKYHPKEWAWMQEKQEGIGMIRWLWMKEQEEKKEKLNIY